MPSIDRAERTQGESQYGGEDRRGTTVTSEPSSRAPTSRIPWVGLDPRRRLVAVVAAVFIALGVTACGTSSAPDTVSESGIDAATGEDIWPEFLAILDVDVARKLSGLQLVVDRVVEGKVDRCMREQGFEYRPTTVAEFNELELQQENTPLLQAATSAIDFLIWTEQEDSSDESDNGHPGGQEAVGDEAWEAAYIQCLVDASNAFENPLADAGSWYSGAYVEAAQRTGSDPRSIRAEQQFDECSSRSGYGSIGEASQLFSSEVDAIMNDFADGAVGRASAITLLQEVETAELEASEAFEACLAPFQDIQQHIFAENMAALADRDADRSALWAVEIEAAIESYTTLLREIEESGDL